MGGREVPVAWRAGWITGAAAAGAVALLALAGLVPPAAAAGTTSGAPSLLPLRAPGGPLLGDAAGRAVELHGVDLVPKCGARTSGNPCLPDPAADAPAYHLSAGAADPGRRLDDHDAQALQDLGVNAVRLGVFWEGIEPGPPGATQDDPTYCAAHSAQSAFAPLPAAAEPWNGAVAARYLDRVAASVRLLAAHGIRTILALYQDVWGAAFANPQGQPPWMGDGAPRWATCTGGAPFLAPPTWGAGYTTFPVAMAFQHFFLNDVAADLQAEYIRSAVALATRFRGDPAVVGYDVFNDPSEGVSSLLPGAFDRELQCFLAGSRYAPMSCQATAQSQAPVVGVIPAVQAADPDHLVFFQPPLLSDVGYPETVGIAEKLPFDRLVLDVHDYGPGILLSPDGSCPVDCSGVETGNLRNAEAERDQTMTAQTGGPALFVGEWGAESDPAHLEPLAAAMDSAGLSWTYYMGKQLNDPSGTTAEALLDDSGTPRGNAPAVARVYASAVAGTNAVQSYDPATRHYTLSYTPQPGATAPTEVTVPRWSYPAGYGATVSGATILSACGDRSLVLVAAPGATSVSVDLVPATCAVGSASGHAAITATPSPGVAPARLNAAGATGLPDTGSAAPGGPGAAWLATLVVLAVPCLRRQSRPGRDRARRSTPRHRSPPGEPDRP